MTRLNWTTCLLDFSLYCQAKVTRVSSGSAGWGWGVEMTSERSVAEAREVCYFCETDRSEKAAWAAIHPPKMSVLYFYYFFCFFVFIRNNGNCRGSGISILNLRSSNVQIVGQERWHLLLCQPNPSEEWAKFSLVQIPFSVTGGNLTAHPLSWHALLALRSNSFVGRVFSGFLCCSPSWLDNQVHAVDHPGLQSAAAICEELVSI